MDSKDGAPAPEVAPESLEVITEILEVTTETLEVTTETLEVSTEVPSEATQSAIEVNQTLIPLPEEGKSIECNGDSARGGELGMPSYEDENGERNEITLERATELFEKGSKAFDDGDFVEAVDSLSRALEIRVAIYGELAPECASSYFKYGCALLSKAQVETDPLGDVLKSSSKNSAKDTTISNVEDCVSSMPSSTLNKPDSTPNIQDLEGGSGDKNQEDEIEDCEEDVEELGEAEEDDSDLDYAWKMLDIARAIIEKNPEDSFEKADVFCALAEVSMEREDVEASLSDYHRALAILEHLVEPDDRRVVEINFRISLVLEVGSKVEEAIPYCAKAISLCKSRIERFQEASIKSKDSEEAGEKSLNDLDKTLPGSSSEPSKLGSEIDVLSSILTDLERKLEDLQQLMPMPKSVLAELLKKNISPSPAAEKVTNDYSRSLSINSSQMAVMETGGFDSPTISTAANDDVRHLGVVGRGIKRPIISSTSAELSPMKPLPDFSPEKAENIAAEKNVTNDCSRSLFINSSQMAVLETGGSPTISTAANDDVRHLGVAGRGIKRPMVSSTGAELSPKKPLPDFSAEKAENSVSEAPSPLRTSESSNKHPHHA